MQNDVVVDGRRIRYWSTEVRDRQLVMIHGASAHSLWWGPLIPLLARRFQCIAIDNSGHGDSDHARTYTSRQWITEVEAVCEHVGSHRPDFVGHSRGGRLAILAAARPECRARGLVLLDSGIRPRHLHRPPSQPLNRPQRTYESFPAARRAFRLLPEQDAVSESIIDEVASYAIREHGGRWGWKYDAAAPLNIDDAEVEQAIPHVTIPVAFAYGARSAVVSDAMVDHVRRALQPLIVERIPEAEHHLILSHPVESARFIQNAVDRFESHT